MNTGLQYKVLFVRNRETALDFLINQLGFELCEAIEIDGQVCPLLKNRHNHYMVLFESSIVDNVNILPTDDCLRDYFHFKQKSLQALGKPQYQDKGLAIGFSDPSGTRFVLLEERDYSEA